MPGHVPPPGALFLDHTGHFVADIDAARSELDALGFTATPFSAQVQPDPATGKPELTGTGNICVMLPQGYLEILTHTADTPLGQEFNAALAKRAGLHLVAFGAADVEKRHAALTAAGYPMRPLVHFSRDVDCDAGAIRASFSVARLQAGTFPEGRVQICTHHTPDALWQPRWTRHRNGAQKLVALVIASRNPGEAAERYSRLLGRRSEALGPGLRISLARGALEFVTADVVERLTGEQVMTEESVFVAVRLAVSDLSALIRLVGHRAIHASRSSLVVPFGFALGKGAFLFEAC